MAQPLPTSSSIRPVLKDLGFSIYALSPPLSVPLDVRLAASSSGVQLQDTVRPDIVLTRPKDNRYGFVECKKNSFSPSSTSSVQIRTYLASVGARAWEALGVARTDVRSSALTVATVEDAVEPMRATLQSLAAELSSKSISPATFHLLGFRAHPNQITLVLDSAAQSFYGAATPEMTAISVDAENDPRPLYFIPYDPDLGGDANSTAFGKRVLFERLLSGLLVAVGRATPPTTLTLTMNRLLNDAMFGLFSKWENGSSRRSMITICKQFVQSCFRTSRLAPTPATWAHGDCLVSIPDDNEKRRIIEGLSHLLPESMMQNLADNPVTDIEEF